MAEKTFTPSPWFWAEDSKGRRTNLMRSGSGDYVVSPQYDVADYGLSVDMWNDVSDEDAALIEAAPDLVEALQDVVNYFWNPDIDKPVLGERDVEDLVREALRKARGEA